MAYLDERQLREIGLAGIGKNVLVSERCSLYGAERIRIGDGSRVDDFCILSAGSGGIEIGRNVHVACYSSLIGADTITLKDFANISARVSIYSSNDDYSGLWMTNPTVPSAYTNVFHGPVTVGRHVIIGCGAIVLPAVDLGEGCAIGALSLVKSDCESFGVYAGVPAKFIRQRARDLLRYEELLRTASAAIPGPLP